MNAIGIDLGGSKIETQVFDQSWSVAARNRVATPKNYEELVRTLADQVAWAENEAGGELPIGIGAAGLIHPDTGLAVTANVCASGKPLPEDLRSATKRSITYINDCRALALSETVFGAGQGYRTVLALIIGTGVGGGITVNSELQSGPTSTGGEFGHISASAHILAKYNLTPLRCGCGSIGCIETYLSGVGMSRIAKTINGVEQTPPEIARLRNIDPKCANVWGIWCELAADFIRSLTLVVDPDVIVLAGGLSKIDGLIESVAPLASKIQIGSFGIPPLVLAQGGDSSGARGAAYEAFTQSTSMMDEHNNG